MLYLIWIKLNQDLYCNKWKKVLVMKLSELLNCTLDIEINGIKTDSRQVEKGDLFICIKGLTNDGHEFINSAIKNGAVAILAEKKVDCEVPLILEHDIVNKLPLILSKFYAML